MKRFRWRREGPLSKKYHACRCHLRDIAAGRYKRICRWWKRRRAARWHLDIYGASDFADTAVAAYIYDFNKLQLAGALGDFFIREMPRYSFHKQFKMPILIWQVYIFIAGRWISPCSPLFIHDFSPLLPCFVIYRIQSKRLLDIDGYIISLIHICSRERRQHDEPFP